MADQRYRVVAEYITVRTAQFGGHPTSRGPAMVGVYRDRVLPTDVPADDIERLLALGMIEPLEQPEQPVPAEVPD
jgi:hypothetical protein